MAAKAFDVVACDGDGEAVAADSKATQRCFGRLA
jgi:hypothetical protein